MSMSNMISPYLERPARSLSEAIADMGAAAQSAADATTARHAVTFMLARFRDMRHAARTSAQLAAYDRQIRSLEDYLSRA
jgi:hypothetical protein